MSERSVPSKPTPARMREINDTIRYAMWSVFAAKPLGDVDRAEVAEEVETLFEELARRV